MAKGDGQGTSKTTPKVTIVIPAAGLGRRMKSYGPKALIEIGRKQTLVSRQLAILKNCFPQSSVIVVVGFEADRVARTLPADVRVVENESFEQTNVCRSIFMGVRSCGQTDAVLIVYGDLVFNSRTFDSLPTDRSVALVDTHGRFRDNEVGCTVIGGNVVHFSYGLPTKWAQIVLLTGHELETFKRLAASKNRRRHFGFEVLNDIIEQGGIIEAREPKHMKVVEIDTSKDIDSAKQIEV